MKQKIVPFPLRPIETATVSVISEATAAADIPAAEKINFHIGNPLQDNRLTDRYFEICSGYSTDIFKVEQTGDNELSKSELEKLLLIHKIIENAVPYAPRNGFSAKKLPVILERFKKWLTEQQEPLKYSFGDARPSEITLSNGGVNEFLRVLFSTVERFSINLPVKLITFSFELPEFIKDFGSILHIESINDIVTSKKIKQAYLKIGSDPVIALVGRKLNEKERTLLRQESSNFNILFCELVDLKNHQSLARESGLQDSVLRFLSPGILNDNISDSATQFILGNSEIIKLFSAIHFELKGTPSATERDWLEYAVENLHEEMTPQSVNQEIESGQPIEKTQKVIESATAIVNTFSNKLDRFSEIVEKNSRKFESLGASTLENLNSNWPGTNYSDDLEFKSVTSLFPTALQDPQTIKQAFLNQFIKHQTQYNVKNCFVVSGSARTALSLLGKHCGIKEIVTFDWSWTYENGFNKIEAVPLFENNRLNSAGLKKKVQSKVTDNPHWKREGAVVFNNPHNASGYVFNESEIKKLLVDLLEQNITVIDDLSYQDVAPSRIPLKIKTLKELANEAIKNGLLRSDKINNLITAHSLSKTDCFAGARLSVVEIGHAVLKERFADINGNIKSNSMAILLAYLFYRNDNATLKQFWQLRNLFFAERAESIIQAVKELPAERNPFKIKINMPQGAMYPQMVIENFPQGISIDNISTRLSQRGIGLVPLTAFSKTATGYEAGRKTFRLTLGGTDNQEVLGNKTRRLLIELNRILHEEARDYQLLKLKTENDIKISPYFSLPAEKWQKIIKSIQDSARANFKKSAESIQNSDQQEHFTQNYLPWRLSVLDKRFNELMALYSRIISKTQQSNSENIANRLTKEFFKETIEERQQRFKDRLFDRTVHPTQMYALNVDVLVDRAFASLVYGSGTSIDAKQIGLEIVKEFFGLNIPINSEEEAYELIYDLRTMVRNELYTENKAEYLLSFWGDWDGSTRPSGQGHRLVAAVLIENVRHMAYFLKTLNETVPKLKIENDLLNERGTLLKKSKNFWQLLNRITSLTNQLEKSYRGLLPAIMQPGRLRKIAIKLKLSRDPLRVLFSHNSGLEKKMLQLREQRKGSLEYWFELNKALRKKLYELIPVIVNNINDPKIALLAGGYKNLLKRFVLTPRIHQKTITSTDPFTIENTVHNLSEINQIGARFGNPGICMALQISMSTNAEAVIKLNRMVVRKRESLNKENSNFPIRDLWLIPLFEDQETLDDLITYLDKIWAFAEHSRTIEQTVSDRFKEITCEIFVAGSDLSQQVGQPKSLELFKRTKVLFYKWLAQKGMLSEVRIKLGCGEPIQRQGGYYSDLSGKAALYNPQHAKKNISGLSKPAQKSLSYASSPLAGLHLGGDLRTIQSNAAERVFRFISYEQRSQLFYHMDRLQKIHKNDLIRVGAMFTNTRRDLAERGIDEIKRISNFNENNIFQEFVNKNRESFRQIIYGQDEDAVGIHVISYFISRMTPTLRDRPTVRPTKENSQDIGQQIVERIAQTLPMSHHGSSLRAIGHNRAQSAILGVSQASTGLFRTLKIIRELYQSPNTIALVLSNLPVKEILYDLRMYQQTDLKYIKNLESAFDSGNTALRALYEDFEYMYEFIPHLQQALVAKQGLSAADFFIGNKFKQDLLQYFRPDLAVLLQNNLFNREINNLGVNLKHVDPNWILKTNKSLLLPNQLADWREKIWQLIEGKIYHQVSSFVDLAMALTSLSNTPKNESSISITAPGGNRLTNQVNTLLRGTADDSVRHLLYSVAEYIARLPEDSRQLPIDTVRVLNDIERIIKIDSQPLSENEQSKLRFYILEIARLARENG